MNFINREEYMALTVEQAFYEFMRDTVDLDPQIVKNARESRNNNLLENINEFDNDDFFNLCPEYNLHFGSFSRKTKCRELDDIDLMIGISADGATYNPHNSWDNVTITASDTDTAQIGCSDNYGRLNSISVLNKFKKELENVREYSRSDIKRNGEAVTLNLKSKQWNFDIVPCFHTEEEQDGRDYYLIPNGKGNGNWKKTDPKREQRIITRINNKHLGRVLNTIRLIKYWNKRGQMPTMPSYVLETMVINYFNSSTETSEWIEDRFYEVLKFIFYNIQFPIYDLKGIEGDINTLSANDKNKIRTRAKNDCHKAYNAIFTEIKERNMQKAINMWDEILG